MALTAGWPERWLKSTEEMREDSVDGVSGDEVGEAALVVASTFE
jgi:hypothetical protein